MSGSLRNELSSLRNAEVSSIRQTVATPIQAVAFWVAVVLPFLYVPLLAAGLDTAGTMNAFFGLLAANAVALLVGHPHLRD